MTNAIINYISLGQSLYVSETRHRGLSKFCTWFSIHRVQTRKPIGFLFKKQCRQFVSNTCKSSSIFLRVLYSQSRVLTINRDAVHGQHEYCVINAFCDDSEEGLSYTWDFTLASSGLFSESSTAKVLRTFQPANPKKVVFGWNSCCCRRI